MRRERYMSEWESWGNEFLNQTFDMLERPNKPKPEILYEEPLEPVPVEKPVGAIRPKWMDSPNFRLRKRPWVGNGWR